MVYLLVDKVGKGLLGDAMRQVFEIDSSACLPDVLA